ncbi:MAG: helix-turn-helix domain-containing protein [Patescibacteria group bacterium]|nr:helix-turn-helix domain-containing protein [Patescibacteria group bacterium]
MEKEKIHNVLYDALKTLELSDRAIDLYIIALSLGPISVTKLSKELGIARPNVYKLITELKDQKLVEESTNSKKSGPTVVSPSVVLEMVRKEEEKYEKISKKVSSNLPELLSIYAQGTSPSKIKVFEGREQYIKAFDIIFEEAVSPMRFFGSADDFVIFTQWHGYNKLVKKRIRKNIQLQSLLLPSETAENMKRRAKQELREVRILKDMDSFDTSFQLFSKKILFWQPHTPLAILIEDEYITKMMQNIFEKLWTELE